MDSRPLMLGRKGKRTYQLHTSSNCKDVISYENLDGTDVELETSALIEKLVEEDRISYHRNTDVDRRYPVLLLAICGMGGIGKTIIARKIFDDQRMRSAFSTCLWVPMPKSFTDNDVLLATIRAAGSDLKGSETRNERRKLLSNIVRGKRIFLVLNGISITSPRDVDPSTEYAKKHLSLVDTLLVLCNSAEGSRVLMISRDEDGPVKLVQRQRSLGERLAVQIHRIPQLTVEHGWILLRKITCLDQSKSIEEAPQIEITAVKKCNGLPLAIKIMGGVLQRKNNTPQVWKSVCDSEALSFKDLPEGTEGLMGSICLSYQDALPHVKQCLLYLSLFPVDFAIEQHFITQLWISEGFIDIIRHYLSEPADPQNNDSNVLLEEREDGHRSRSSERTIQKQNSHSSQEIVEDQSNQSTTGTIDVHDSHSSQERTDQYKIFSLEDMANECFKELIERNLLQPTKDIRGYMMHERVWSFAQFLTKDEVCQGNHKDMEGLPGNLRYLSFVNAGLNAIPGDIGRLKSLRTLLLSGNPLEEDGLDIIFRNSTFLRVLDLSNTAIKYIPNTLAKLVHLRHLDLSQTKIQELPKSIDCLHRLRFLDLKKCEYLTSLPITIQKLPNLEYLNLRDTKIPKDPPRLQNLRNLTFLHGFVVDNKSSYGWPLEELHDMKNLTSLHMNIRKALHQSSEVLKNMTNLRRLELSCSVDESEGLPLEGIREMITQLHHQPQLQSLKIDGYSGRSDLDWFSMSSFTILQELHLVNCKLCEKLPHLCQLRNLKILRIVGFSKLQAISMQESAGVPSFPNLEELHIGSMQNLKSLSELKAGDMPLLQKFHLYRCPKMKSLPSGLEHCKMLTTIEVGHAELLEVIENVVSLKELLIETMPNLSKLSNLPLLKVFTVRDCLHLDSIMGVNSLRHIHIEDIQLVQLPKWLEPLASRIETLDIVGNAELLGRCERNKDDWYVIREIARVYTYLPDRLSYSSYTRSNDFFCKYNRSTAHAREDPSVPADSVEKSDGSKRSSSTNSGGNRKTRPAGAHDTYWLRYAYAQLILLVLACLIVFNMSTPHDDPWEEFYLLILFFLAVFFLPHSIVKFLYSNN